MSSRVENQDPAKSGRLEIPSNARLSRAACHLQIVPVAKSEPRATDPMILLVRMALRAAVEELYRTLVRHAPPLHETLAQMLYSAEKVFCALPSYGFEVEPSDYELFSDLHQALRTIRHIDMPDLDTSASENRDEQFFGKVNKILATTRGTLLLSRQLQLYIEMFEVPRLAAMPSREEQARAAG